ncbi:MAG: hypothetical protein WC408_01545 [Candidatus Micrarchaeia archaeon]|jgi:hypothetical protein
MVSVCVPDELKGKMNTFSEINWSEVARKAFAQKVRDMEILNRFRSESELTEEDALRLGKAVNAEVAKKYARKATRT